MDDTTLFKLFSQHYFRLPLIRIYIMPLRLPMCQKEGLSLVFWGSKASQWDSPRSCCVDNWRIQTSDHDKLRAENYEELAKNFLMTSCFFGFFWFKRSTEAWERHTLWKILFSSLIPRMTTLRKFMPRQGILASWEDIRNTKEVHWAMECFAEMVRYYIPAPSIWPSIGQLGVFIFVYLGESSELKIRPYPYLRPQRRRVRSRLGHWEYSQNTRAF